MLVEVGVKKIYRVIHRSVDKLKLNYPTYYKGKRNKFLIDRMEI